MIDAQVSPANNSPDAGVTDLKPEKKELTVMERLPDPTGWRILILPYQPPEKSSGGIIFTQKNRDESSIATQVGQVLKIGPLAYQDIEKFPDGKPWCKKDDWIMFARYAGSRFKIEDNCELRILNDDEILGVINNPEDIVNMV